MTSHHPSDHAVRNDLGEQLRTLRRDLGFTAAEVGERLLLGESAVFTFEKRMHINPTIRNVQRYARALDRTIRLQLRELDMPRLRVGYHADAEAADRSHRLALLNQMLDVRERDGITQARIGAHMGIGFNGVSSIEGFFSEPRLTTYQRYARALGGWLSAHVVDAAPPDEVAIRRALDGKMRFADLRDAEKAAIFREYGPRFGVNELGRRLGVSGSTIRQWHEQVAA